MDDDEESDMEIVLENLRKLEQTIRDTIARNEELLEDKLLELDRNMHLFLEPAATLRIGHRWLKFHMQAGYSFKVTRAKIAYQPFLVTVGLNFTLAERYNVKREAL